ncbi:MAG: SDR family oxidoreductase [Chloroflexi bacterium]|nr:MAG: SDR family oxidoreductase [Chloroflexota bacterium]
MNGGIAVVTGAAGGIGSAICRRMAAGGYRVAATDLHVDQCQALARELNGSAHALDVTDAAASGALAAELGEVAVVVNNAGWDRFMPFLETTPELWEKLLRINLFGQIAVAHAFARGMAERGHGVIVNVSSDAGKVGSTGETVYAAAKGGVITFTRSLARELARHGVRVNCVCPGPTDTPFLDVFQSEGGQKVVEAMTRAVPMRRLAQPDEIAAAVAFLASDDARFITGQALSVSGGLTMS